MISRPPITRDGAQQDARHELSKALYHRSSDPLPVRAVKWVGHQLDRILGGALDHTPAGGFGAIALVVIIVVFVAAVIWRVGLPRRTPSGGAVLAPGRVMSAADHRDLSEQAASREDWRTAVLERMRAIARELEERSILTPRAGRTATELSAEAARLVPLAARQLAAAGGVFNDVIYGGATATSSQLDSLISADDLIRQTNRSTVLAT
jgi:hypothetical protein